MEDLEQQCEDAIFEVCDARERYPTQCANELAKCIQLTSEMHVETICTKAIESLNVSSILQIQNALFETFDTSLKNQPLTSQILDSKLHNMLDIIENLNIAIKQIESDKLCEINRLIQ